MTALVNSLVDRLVGKIRDEAMRPGDRLSERQLAEEFRVSRSPVRAALQRLTEAGVLAVADRSGYRLAAADAAVALPPPAPDEDGDEDIYLSIARDRLAGALPDRLTEAEFLRRYPLTRARLAALLRRIAAEGWIERLPGHGWAFLPVLTSLETYQDSYRFRLLIEPAGFLEPRFALNREALERRLAEQRWLVEGGVMTVSNARLFDLNSGMHQALMACSRNSFLIDALARVDRLRRLIEYRQTQDRARARERCIEHIAILEATLRGENAEASGMMRRHLATLTPLKSAAAADWGPAGD